MSSPEPFSPEDMARRRKRNIALALFLIAMVAIFFVTTMVRIGGNVMERSL